MAKSLISYSVCLIFFSFGDGWRGPCNMSGVQLARQFMKLSSFICLTYHLSGNLKNRHKVSPMTYTNEKRCNWQLAGITDTERGIAVSIFFRLLAIFLFYYGIFFFSFTKFLLKFFPSFLMISPYY